MIQTRMVMNADGYCGPVSSRHAKDFTWSYRPFNGLKIPLYPKKLFVHECLDGTWVVQMDKKEMRTDFEKALRACVYIAKAKDSLNVWTSFWFKRRIKSIIN